MICKNDKALTTQALTGDALANVCGGALSKGQAQALFNGYIALGDVASNLGLKDLAASPSLLHAHLG